MKISETATKLNAFCQKTYIFYIIVSHSKSVFFLFVISGHIRWQSDIRNNKRFFWKGISRQVFSPLWLSNGIGFTPSHLGGKKYMDVRGGSADDHLLRAFLMLSSSPPSAPFPHLWWEFCLLTTCAVQLCGFALLKFMMLLSFSAKYLFHAKIAVPDNTKLVSNKNAVIKKLPKIGSRSGAFSGCDRNSLLFLHLGIGTIILYDPLVTWLWCGRFFYLILAPVSLM